MNVAAAGSDGGGGGSGEVAVVAVWLSWVARGRVAVSPCAGTGGLVLYRLSHRSFLQGFVDPH